MSRPDRARRLGALFLLMCVLVASCADQPAPTASPSPAPATVGSANPPGPSPTAPGSTPSARPAATGTAPGTAPTAPTGPAQQTPVRPAATATPVQPSSFDKLRAAEESGELDRDTVLVYSLFAAYDPARLPDEYRGEDEGQEVEATTILAEIAERGELMTAALREQVRPFLLRPTDPNSF